MFCLNTLFLNKFTTFARMKQKRPVGRPISGVNKFHVAISLTSDLNEKLSTYAKEHNITKSAVVEKSLKEFFIVT